ncbi:MAG: DUF6550 family protein [Anaerotignaceae bacterium]
MKNMNSKAKKMFVVASGLVVSVVLIVLIFAQFKKPLAVEEAIIEEDNSSQEIFVKTPNMEENESNNEINVEVPEIEILELENSATGDDVGTEQSIQEDVPEKPTYTEEELTNPQQKPNGEKVEPPTVENPNPPQTKDVVKDTSTPVDGGLPGFENVPYAGENEGEFLENMYENGNKIGIMD